MFTKGDIYEMIDEVRTAYTKEVTSSDKPAKTVRLTALDEFCDKLVDKVAYEGK